MSTVDRNVEVFRVKKLIERLDSAKGAGTSMISLVIPSGDQVATSIKMLTEEIGKAGNIKSRVNRQSVQSAMTSAIQCLKHYPRTPKNGLCVYTGTCMMEDGNTEKKMTFDFEPFKPVNQSLYYCDSKFHTEPLGALLQSDERYGFIIMDGKGTLYGTLCGNAREILQHHKVELPKKHRKGGQSSVRFSRLRDESRHNYVRKVAEMATSHFIKDDKPAVKGIVLAGSADFKNVLADSSLFDPRLQRIVLQIVDISYGGEAGFSQAIELSKASLANVKFVHEKELLDGFYEEIATDSGKYCFGIKDLLHCIDMGSIETIIVWEDLDITRVVMRDSTDNEVVKFLNAKDMENSDNFRDAVTGNEMDRLEAEPITDWLILNYKTWGANLEFVTDKSPEGAQFCSGFGGIGGVLRWKVDLSELMDFDDSDDDSDLELFM